MDFKGMTPQQAAEKIVGDSFPEYAFSKYRWEEAINNITTACQHFSNEQLERNRAVDRQADVAAFFRKFSVPMPETPGWPEQQLMDLRVRLIAEEFGEFLEAAGYEGYVRIDRWSKDPQYAKFVFKWRDSIGTCGQRNLAQAADALIDLQYVCEGGLISLGINSNPLWAEVQRANMAKEGGGTREDGKILKPAGWQPPNIEGKLREQGWGGE